MSAALSLFRRDVALVFRGGGGFGLSLGFFVLVAVMLPLGVGRDIALLERLAPGLLWLAATLAALLSLESLFQADLEDGTVDQLLLSPAPLELLVLAKVVAHWLTTALPLALAAPLIGLLLGMEPADWGALVLSMMIGTPALSFLGAGAAGLTSGLRRGGLLLSLIVLPLYVPVVIFGAAAARDAASPEALILGGISLFAMVIGPLAAAAALRLHVS